MCVENNVSRVLLVWQWSEIRGRWTVPELPPRGGDVFENCTAAAPGVLKFWTETSVQTSSVTQLKLDLDLRTDLGNTCKSRF